MSLLHGIDTARTVFPTLSVDSYELSFNGPVAMETQTTTSATVSVQLPVGTWDISANAISDGQVIASGSAEDVSVELAATATASIALLPMASAGSGTIDITVSWPAGAGVLGSSVSATLDGKAVNAGSLSVTATSAHYVESVSSGVYTFCLSLSTGGAFQTVITESVHVYANLTSALTLALTEDDFTSPPEAPTDLSATPGTNTITLSWKDNSPVETSYTLERTTTSGNYSSALVVVLGANIRQYLDSAVTVGTTYYYRLKASNTFGDSAYCAETSCRIGGALGISITVQTPTDAAITFSISDDIVAGPADLLSVSVAESYDAYEWWLDGTLQGTGQTISINCALLEPGVHRLTVIVEEGSMEYSATVRFRVEN